MAAMFTRITGRCPRGRRHNTPRALVLANAAVGRRPRRPVRATVVLDPKGTIAARGGA